jgi:hypothetical protein
MQTKDTRLKTAIVGLREHALGLMRISRGMIKTLVLMLDSFLIKVFRYLIMRNISFLAVKI